MGPARVTTALALLILALGVAPFSAQAPAPAARPSMAPQEMETFLRGARIVARTTEAKGTTGALRVTLDDGRMKHDAQVQDVDEFRSVFDVDKKHTEFNFRDTYRYNIAAYRLARLLGLDIVPMSIERQVDGRPAAITWWVDDVAMDEGARLKMNRTGWLGPDPTRTSGYFHILHVFDELIQNRDRNSGNLLWTRDWTMWMIDHTRAFRTATSLLNPASLEKCERNLLTALRGLTRASLSAAVGNTLMRLEMDTLLARRDAIVKVFDERIARSGEAAVLYSMR